MYVQPQKALAGEAGAHEDPQIQAHILYALEADGQPRRTVVWGVARAAGSSSERGSRAAARGACVEEEAELPAAEAGLGNTS